MTKCLRHLCLSNAISNCDLQVLCNINLNFADILMYLDYMKSVCICISNTSQKNVLVFVFVFLFPPSICKL